jgi:hypothetical protein
MNFMVLFVNPNVSTIIYLLYPIRISCTEKQKQKKLDETTNNNGRRICQNLTNRIYIIINTLVMNTELLHCSSIYTIIQ